LKTAAGMPILQFLHVSADEQPWRITRQMIVTANCSTIFGTTTQCDFRNRGMGQNCTANPNHWPFVRKICMLGLLFCRFCFDDRPSSLGSHPSRLCWTTKGCTADCRPLSLPSHRNRSWNTKGCTVEPCCGNAKMHVVSREARCLRRRGCGIQHKCKPQ